MSEDHFCPLPRPRLTSDKINARETRISLPSRQEHCHYENNTCLSAHEDGIGILHGAAGTFHSWDFPGIRTAADVFMEWDFQSDSSGLADEMERRLAMLDDTASCDPLRLQFFSKTLRKQLSQTFVLA